MNGTHRRSRSHTARNRAILASVLASSAALLVTAAVAPADASRPHYAMNGRAYGIGLSNISLLGSPIPSGASPDTGLVQTSTTTDTTAPCGDIPAGVVTATQLCPEVKTAVDPYSVDSTATVATAHVGLPGLPVINLVGVRAEAKASCDDASAKTTIDYLKVAGTVVIAQRTVVAPNTVVNLGAITLILNEQSVGSASSSVNAVHVETGVPGLATTDVVISSASAAVTTCYAS